MIKQRRSGRNGRIAASGGDVKDPPARASTRPDPFEAPIELGDCPLVRLAGDIYSTRRDRRRYLDVSLFGEAAWDMLLLLYWADAHGHGLNTSILTRAVGVPSSVALRWLKYLESRGLVVQQCDMGGHLNHIVELTESARSRLTQYLKHIAFADLPTGV